jgi:hypothetical protein
LKGIPLFSVTALIGVSAWITNDAIMIIIDPSDSSDVNVLFLFGFAAGNALIDIICAALFFIRRDDVLKNYVAVDSKSGNSRNESLLKVIA